MRMLSTPPILLLLLMLLAFATRTAAASNKPNDESSLSASSTSHQTTPSLSHRHLRSLSSSSSSSSLSNSNRNLVIGGHDAPKDRYPYYVALQNAKGKTECGGTLIAPDVILTAAHCADSKLKYALVGKYWNDNDHRDDHYERIKIVNPLKNGNYRAIVQRLKSTGDAIVDASGFIHPDHNLEERTYDVMLMKLQRPSTKPTVKVNFNPNVPRQRNGNEILVVGLGRTAVGGPKPDLLQQAYLDFIPYEDCIDSAAYNLDYKFELLTDMMCTQGFFGLRGQCYGDSGGPYLSLGDTYQQDVQVAVVSWSVNCASPLFPMVGSRTSASESFIRNITCAITANPAAAHLCTTTSFTPSNLVKVTNGVTVSVNIYADPYPHEISWKIMSADKTKLFAKMTFGSIQGDHGFFKVDLPPGQKFIFSISDAADDGIFGDVDAILYEVVMIMDQGSDIVLLAGNGGFSTTRQRTFGVPLPAEYPSLMAPPPKNNVDPIGGDTTYVTVLVRFDFGDYHEDLAWAITEADNESVVLVSKDYDSYRYGNVVTEQVRLPVGSYHFVVRDRRGTDEYRAFDSYRVSYRDVDGTIIPLVTSQGVFSGKSKTREFTIPKGGSNSGSGGGARGSGSGAAGGGGQGSDGECINSGLPCQVSSKCCGGRCVANTCRSSVGDTKHIRDSIGRADRGGGASGTRERNHDW